MYGRREDRDDGPPPTKENKTKETEKMDQNCGISITRGMLG
jgi:hypothetical protein